MASNRPSNKSRKNGSTSTVTTNDQDSNASQVVPIASSSPNNTRLSSSTPLHSRTLALDILKILTTPPKWRVPWHTLATAYAVPPDGIGLHISLVQLTDLLFIQSHSYAEAKKNRLNVVHENPEMDKVPKHVKNGTKGRGLFGTCCENPDCSYTAMSVSVSGERKSGQAEMKRCGGCVQVTYCTVACQRSDWARHKAFCKSVDPRKASKDGILRLIRRLLPNPCLMVLIKLYAKSLLRLEEDPGAGMRNNIVFTCTTVEDCVKGGNDKDGNQMTRSVFQISKVERFAVNEPTIDFSSSISSATGPSPSDSSSLSSIVPPPSTHTASPPSNALMSPADLEAHRNQRYEGPYCYMTFKTDVPGSGGSVRSVEKVYYEMMKQMPFAMPEPVVALLQFNQTIRDDIDDKFRLRTLVYG